MSFSSDTASIAPEKSWQDSVPTSLRGPTILLSVLVFGFFSIFVSWSFLAPLGSAIVTSGVFVANGFNQVVQHRNGGVVAAILAREGETVAAGDPIVLLDDTIDRAAFARLTARLDSLMAIEARLEATGRNAPEIVLPDVFGGRLDDQRIVKLIADQQAVFEGSREEFAATVAVLEQRKLALDEQIIGLQAQSQAVASELRLVRNRLADLRQLQEKGLAARPQVTEVEVREAQLSGQQGELVAAIAQTRERIIESTQELQGSQARRATESANNLATVRSELAEVREQYAAARRVLEETIIVAPTDGIVVKLAINTVGGVAQAGASIAEILPADNPLIIEAKILPDDIDVVYVGQTADVFVTAFDRNETERAVAIVTYVAADRQVDRDTGVPFYVARLKLEDSEDSSFSGLDRIQPGMQAEVFINIGERTFFQYLTGPITASLRRAFREQ